MAVRRLARRRLSQGRAPAGLARALRRRVRHGRGEQRVLPAARAGGVRALARPDARRVRRGGEGESVPHSHPAPARPAGAGRPPRRSGRGPGRPARARTCSSCRRTCAPTPAGSTPACRLPAGARVAVEPRHESWWTDEVREVLDRRGAALCWADRARPPVHAAVANRRWGYVRMHEGTASPRPSYGRTALGTWLDRIDARGPAPVAPTFRLLQQRPRRRRRSATPARCGGWLSGGGSACAEASSSISRRAPLQSSSAVDAGISFSYGSALLPAE